MSEQFYLFVPVEGVYVRGMSLESFMDCVNLLL